jgi:hypothetical protein
MLFGEGWEGKVYRSDDFRRHFLEDRAGRLGVNLSCKRHQRCRDEANNRRARTVAPGLSHRRAAAAVFQGVFLPLRCSGFCRFPGGAGCPLLGLKALLFFLFRFTINAARSRSIALAFANVDWAQLDTERRRQCP